MILRAKKIRTLILSAIASTIPHMYVMAGEKQTFDLKPDGAEKICKEIRSNSLNGNFHFVKEDRVSNLTLNLGEFDLTKIPGGELYVKGALLVIPARLSLASSSCGNSICISHEETTPMCPRTKTYRLSVMIDSLAFGPGNFQSNESLSFYDKQGMEFENGFSLTGTIHKPQSTLGASREDAKRLFADKSEALRATIKNTGDRNLNIKQFSEIKNTAGIQIKMNECQNQVLAPSQSCSLIFERTAGTSKSAEQYYEVAFDSNDVFGFGKIIISKEKNNGIIDVGIWHK